MGTRGKPRSSTRRQAATRCAGILDSDLFKALGEPARIELVRLLIERGRSDLGALAGALPQDTSVISRHLAVLHRAGLVRRERQGRHALFELDGPALLARVEDIAAQLREAVPFCCPGGSVQARARPSRARGGAVDGPRARRSAAKG